MSNGGGWHSSYLDFVEDNPFAHKRCDSFEICVDCPINGGDGCDIKVQKEEISCRYMRHLKAQKDREEQIVVPKYRYVFPNQNPWEYTSTTRGYSYTTSTAYESTGTTSTTAWTISTN